MTHIQKKICMLGAFAVGKTSLVERFVKGNYKDRYHTTVGLKLDWRMVEADGQSVKLIIWDLAGEDGVQQAKIQNLRGASGYLLVADGTRNTTLDTARQLRDRAVQQFGDLPFILAINKADLTEEWEIDERALAELSGQGWKILRSSAKTGDGVEEAFALIVREILARAQVGEGGEGDV